MYRSYKSQIFTQLKHNPDFFLDVGGICTLNKLLSIMSINDTLQEKLSMTRIKIMSIATENLWNAERVDEYLEITSNINPSTMHFSIK